MSASSARILELVDQGFRVLDERPDSCAAAVRIAVRIARLGQYSMAAFAFEYDLADHTIEAHVQAIYRDLREVCTAEQARQVSERVHAQFIAERKYEEIDSGKGFKRVDSYASRPLDEIEATIESLKREVANEPPLNEIAARTTWIILRQRLYGYQSVIARIRSRVFTFLSKVEQRYQTGQINATIFDSYRSRVDAMLSGVAPDVLQKFNSVYQRIDEGDAEALSQALTSCRRILKAVADLVYPANDAKITGPDGIVRVMSDDKFVNRLYQFVEEASGSDDATTLLRAQIGDVESRFKALNALSSKGTHAMVLVAEAHQCAIQTYLVAGDVLRLHDPQKTKALETPSIAAQLAANDGEESSGRD